MASAVVITAFTGKAVAQNLFVANSGNNTISEITSSGIVSIFASGEGLDDPQGLAFDATGNLFVANSGNSTISEISTNGTISTFASGGGLDNPQGLAFDAAGNLFVLSQGDEQREEVKVYSASGKTIETYTTGLTSNQNDPFLFSGLSAGSFYFAGAGRISEITTNGKVSIFASGGGLDDPQGLAFDATGNLLVANSGNSTISEISTNGTVSTFASGGSLNTPRTLVFDLIGNLYFSNADNETISEISTNGTVTTFASGGGLDDPQGLAFQPVPEPTTYALFGLGALAMVIAARHRVVSQNPLLLY